MKRYIQPALLLFFVNGVAGAFTQVQLAPGIPETIETSFLASTTAQWQGQLIKNPFFANTYTFILQGPNQAYNPPPTNQQLLNAVVTVDSWTYVAGWANGAQYQNMVDEGIVGGFGINCSSPTTFNLISSSSQTFDTKTCQDVANTINATLYQLNLSTPTVVPGGF